MGGYRKIIFLLAVFFLLNISIINAGVYIIEHKSVFDEIRELQIKKQERYKWLSEWYEKREEQFMEFKAKRSNWRRIISKENAVGSTDLTGVQYIIGYDERYDSFRVRDTGVITERGFKTGSGWTVYEIYSVNRNKDLESGDKLEMFEKWRERERKEKEKEE